MPCHWNDRFSAGHEMQRMQQRLLPAAHETPADAKDGDVIDPQRGHSPAFSHSFIDDIYPNILF